MAPVETRHNMDVGAVQARLLAWYDRHRRVLPWRALPGQDADPYLVWLSEIMLQQTTVGAVAPYFTAFARRWPDVASLAAARDEDVMAAWAGLGYYSRARNLLACARAVAGEHDGVFPDAAEILRRLPGIGDYTAAAITAIAFGRQATVIDGNVERVAARLFAVETPLPAAKPALRRAAEIVFRDVARPGDFAQALMDLGSSVCIPKSPRCMLCPLTGFCEARRLGIQDALPRKAVKPQKPRRKGYVYWLQDAAGQTMLCQRPPRGLLGGMAALPTSDWVDEADAMPSHPAGLARGVEVSGAELRHVFTHFELRLIPVRGAWTGPLPATWRFAGGAVADWGLPTVFKKAALLMAK